MDRLQREREAFKRDQLRALEKPKSTAPRKRKAAEPAASPRAAPAPRLATMDVTQAAPQTKPVVKAVLDINTSKALHQVITLLKDYGDALHIAEVWRRAGLDGIDQASLQVLEGTMRSKSKLHFEGDMVSYQPTYDVRDIEELRAKLAEFDIKGLGGMREDELKESYPTMLSDLEFLYQNGEVHRIKRGEDPKVNVYFYRPKKDCADIDQEFVELWRRVPIEAKGVADIENHLRRAGLPTMKTQVVKEDPSKTTKKKRRDNIKVANVHMVDDADVFFSGP